MDSDRGRLYRLPFWVIVVVLVISMKMNRDLNIRVFLCVLLTAAILWQAW